MVELLRATAYLRLGEELNCHLANNRDSCLLPIQGEGVHQKREGATRAVEVLKGILDEDPDNLQARWLLNVAHMTLGSYPEGVSKRDLIPPAVFASEYPLPAFENVAKQVGVDVYGLAGGAILDDFDNDGRLDLMVSHSGFEDQTRFFRNRGDGTFEDRTESAGLAGEMGGLNMVQADYDNDGLVDALVLRGGWMGPDGEVPPVPASEQGERDLHGRHESRRATGASRADPDRDLARLRRGRLARPLRRQRDSRRRIRGAEPLRALPQQPRWNVHQRRHTSRASTSSASSRAS